MKFKDKNTVKTDSLIKDTDTYTVLDAVLCNDVRNLAVHLTGFHLFLNKATKKAAVAFTTFPAQTPFSDTVEIYVLDNDKHFSLVEDEGNPPDLKVATEDLPVKATANYWDIELGEKAFRIVQLTSYLINDIHYTINILYYKKASSVISVTNSLSQTECSLEVLQTVQLLTNLRLLYFYKINTTVKHLDDGVELTAENAINSYDPQTSSQGYTFMLPQTGKLDSFTVLDQSNSVTLAITNLDTTTKQVIQMGLEGVPSGIEGSLVLTFIFKTQNKVEYRICLTCLEFYFERQYWTYSAQQTQKIALK